MLLSFLKPKNMLFKKSLSQNKNSILNPDMLYEKKVSIPIEVLCNFLPEEFVCYMKYVSSLSFDQEPDYEYMKHLFLTLINSKDSDQLKDGLQWVMVENVKLFK